MALTKDFKDTIKARADREPEFRRALFEGAIQCFIDGDIETGKAVFKDYINATIGFEELSKLIEKSPKSLHRMFSPTGNPRAENLFNIISTIQKREGFKLEVRFGG